MQPPLAPQIPTLRKDRETQLAFYAIEYYSIFWNLLKSLRTFLNPRESFKIFENLLNSWRLWALTSPCELLRALESPCKPMRAPDARNMLEIGSGKAKAMLIWNLLRAIRSFECSFLSLGHLRSREYHEPCNCDIWAYECRRNIFNGSLQTTCR